MASVLSENEAIKPIFKGKDIMLPWHSFLKIRLYILPLFLFSFIQSGLADPLTDYILRRKGTHRLSTGALEKKIDQYFAQHNLKERGSLPNVGSTFLGSKGPTMGGGFVVENSDQQMLLITSAHIGQGRNVFADFHKVDDNIRSETLRLFIPQSKIYSCADDDVSIINLSEIKKELTPDIWIPFLKSFGSFDLENQTLTTRGQNNSPKSYTLVDSYELPTREIIENKNKRPLFENLFSGETYKFVQAGNMIDFSCNAYPSSPEPYNGNALFIPLNTKSEEILETPNFFEQTIFNHTNNLQSQIRLFVDKQCDSRMNQKPDPSMKVNISALSKNLVLPVGIVPGMSGYPLLSNPNLTNQEYEIAGMVSRYNRRMKISYFSGKENILKCIKASLENKTTTSETKFAYSSEFNTTYRISSSFTELPVLPENAGDFLSQESGDGGSGDGSLELTNTAGDGGSGDGSLEIIKVAGDGGSGDGGLEVQKTAGDGGAGDGGLEIKNIAGDGGAGDGGEENSPKKQSFVDYMNENLKIKPGLMYKGQHSLGFKCQLGSSSDPDYLFANWEVRPLVMDEKYNCQPIAFNSELDLAKLLRARLHRTSVSGLKGQSDKNNNMKLSAWISIKNPSQLQLKIKGEFTKEGFKFKFNESILIGLSAETFSPFVKVPISYKGKKALIFADITDLFFTNVERVYRGRFLQQNPIRKISNSPVKAFFSFWTSDMAKGSPPLEVQWH